MAVRVEVRGRNETEFEVIRDMVSGSFVRRTIDMNAPTASILINNREGLWSQRFKRNDFLRIYDDEELVFDGKVFESRKNEKTQQLTVIAWKKEYLDLFDKFCMEAERQLGYTSWSWGGEEMLAGGLPTLQTEGLRPDEMFLAGLGLRTEIQHFFSETDAILESETNTSLQTSGVGSRNSTKSLEIAHLDELSYHPTATMRTQVLTNGLVGYNTPPDVTSMRVRLSGYEPAGTDLEVRASIDDGATWTSWQSPAYNASSGLWADATFSGIANNGTENKARIEIRLTTNTGTNDATPKVRYMRITLFHAISDTGITEGTIDPYVDPDTDNDTAGGDYNKRSRLEVTQGAVKATVAPAGEQYTHWFAFIDEFGAAHFRNPAFYHDAESGVILSRELGTCDDIDVTTVGQIINNLVYVGTGVGNGTLVITETDAFAAGILRNAASIAQFGEIQGMVTEKNVFSIAHADKRSRSIARLLSQEQKAIEVMLSPNDELEVEIGQKVRVQSPKLDTDAVVRILEESFTFDAKGMRSRSLVLGNNIPSVNTVLAALRRGMESLNLTDQGSRSPPAVSFHDNVDATHPCEMAFYIPEDMRIRRIGLHLKTSPFRAYSKAVNISGMTIEGEGAHTHGMAHTHSIPGSSHQHGIQAVTDGAGARAPGSTDVYIPSAKGNVFSPIFLGSSFGAGPRWWSWASVTGLGSGDSTVFNSNSGFVIFINFTLDAASAEPADTTFRVRLRGNGSSFKEYWSEAVRVYHNSGLSGEVVNGNQQYRLIHIPSAQLKADFPGSSYLEAAELIAVNNGVAVSYSIAAMAMYHVPAHNHPHTGTHTHNLVANTSNATIPPSVSSGPSSNATTTEGSTHTHAFTGGDAELEFGIFEYNDPDGDGTGLVWPKDLQVYIKDFPDNGDNPDPQNLTVPFDRFGKRGRRDQSITVENMDMSVAFRNADGTFKTGFQQMWVKPAVDAPTNPNGLGRINAYLFIEQQQDVED